MYYMDSLGQNMGVPSGLFPQSPPVKFTNDYSQSFIKQLSEWKKELQSCLASHTTSALQN